MSLKNRNLVTIDDFSNEEIEALFSLADVMSESINSQSQLCQNKIMASLFFEPSTRTRLSFEAAMHRLGGRVISAVDIGATSLAKGESIADMARVIGSYADIIVIRHPWEGAAKVVADYASIPVINAGDGSHEHPTQTLCDLYTLVKERKTIKGLSIALCGDLKYGRTVHSLAYALARFGVGRIYFRSGPGLELPPHVLRKLTQDYGGIMYKGPASDLSSLARVFEDRSVDAVYITPTGSHQLTLMPNVKMDVSTSEGAIYITRFQKERASENSDAISKEYPRISPRLLKKKDFEETLVMHPLPRIDELAYEMDADPRSMYFKQAARGVPVRMAIIALLLGAIEPQIPAGEPVTKMEYPTYKREFGVKCQNQNCVSRYEARYIKSEFKIVSTEPLILRCVYCERELSPKYIASSQWHEGKLEYKRYHSADSHWLHKISPENLIIFESENEAEAHGFKPSSHIRKADSK